MPRAPLLALAILLLAAPAASAGVRAVRSARRVAPLSRRVALAGHSQGGHAALWAASLAPKWTPELKVEGTVAFAPVSHLGEQTGILPSLGSVLRGLGGFASLIVRGARCRAHRSSAWPPGSATARVPCTRRP